MYIIEKNGGLTTVENIIPICSSCNSSIRSNNMNEYINTYYPHNIKKLILKWVLLLKIKVVKM